MFKVQSGVLGACFSSLLLDVPLDLQRFRGKRVVLRLGQIAVEAAQLVDRAQRAGQLVGPKQISRRLSRPIFPADQADCSALHTHT